MLTRDMDILSSIREHSPVLCKVTITTVDQGLADKIEPHASPVEERFAMIEKLSGAGIFSGILKILSVLINVAMRGSNTVCLIWIWI